MQRHSEQLAPLGPGGPHRMHKHADLQAERRLMVSIRLYHTSTPPAKKLRASSRCRRGDSAFHWRRRGLVTYGIT